MYAQILLAGEGVDLAARIVSKIAIGILYAWIVIGILAIIAVLAFTIVSWNKGRSA